MARHGDLRGRKSADFPGLRDDAREEEGRKAILRLFDRKKGEAGPPELLLIECAFGGGLREYASFSHFQSRGGKRDMEE